MRVDFKGVRRVAAGKSGWSHLGKAEHVMSQVPCKGRRTQFIILEDHTDSIGKVETGTQELFFRVLS